MKIAVVLAVALAALCGCRREDIRECTVEIPGLTEDNKQKIVDAFMIRKPGQTPHIYDGILRDSFSFDFDKKTLTMEYDSMKIAKTNIRMIIESAGVEVVFPTNTTGVAGYLNARPETPAK